MSTSKQRIRRKEGDRSRTSTPEERDSSVPRSHGYQSDRLDQLAHLDLSPDRNQASDDGRGLESTASRKYEDRGNASSSKGKAKNLYNDQEFNTASGADVGKVGGDNYIMSTQQHSPQPAQHYPSPVGIANSGFIPADNRGSLTSSDVSSARQPLPSHAFSRQPISTQALSQTSMQSPRGSEAPRGSYAPSKSSGEIPEQLVPPHNVGCACGTNENVCGIIFWPEEPPPKDGKITEKGKSTSRKSGSSKNIPPSSKSKGKAPRSTGTSGGCGPLWGPGITPPPSELDSRTASYVYDDWKNITCRCGWGYFNIEGIWIDGASVRNRKAPSNPLWADNSGQAPPHIREMKFRGGRDDLFERARPDSEN